MMQCGPHPSARLIPLEVEQANSYVLHADTCTIGRSPICQILVEGAIVSRLHARIEHDGVGYFLCDVGSANGTFINGRRIYKPHLLADGDLIGLGSAVPVLRFVA
jgi:pSer/pThr/pTyr-binding forkhead associated (FHA) protein